MSEIDAVIQSHSVQYHQYADDLMLYLSLNLLAICHHLLVVLIPCRRGSRRTRCCLIQRRQRRSSLARASGWLAYSPELSWCPQSSADTFLTWTGLKLKCLNLSTHNCFWRHRSAPDTVANWHVGRVRNLFVLYCILFHDLLLSPISQHSVWSELTCHNSLHWTMTKRGHNRDQCGHSSVWTPAAMSPHSENNNTMKHKATFCDQR